MPHFASFQKNNLNDKQEILGDFYEKELKKGSD